MNGPGPNAERQLALFALGAVLFNPPLLSLFSVDATLVGFPALYIYIFSSWAVLVVLVAVIVNRRRKRRPGLRRDAVEPSRARRGA